VRRSPAGRWSRSLGRRARELPSLAMLFTVLVVTMKPVEAQDRKVRPRARDLGIQVGVLRPGPLGAITDVEGVRVGQTTIWGGDSIRTGVTAILPHAGNLFQQKVPAAIYVGNGFGKLAGVTQVEELGTIETPILLTNTLSVPQVADAVIEYVLGLPGNEEVRSVNPVVGETNDGWLNDIRGRHVSRDDVFAAIEDAASGPVEEGSVGAGTGTMCLGFKGGIGTSSRLRPSQMGGWTVGVLVQTNYGGILEINGAPVGRELGVFSYHDRLHYDDGDGSCMMVVATDAPLSARNLKRLARRAMLGLAKTGSYSSNGSGDYVIAFSTAAPLRRPYAPREPIQQRELLHNDYMSPLFVAVVEATQEAVYNSLLKATTVVGRAGHRSDAIPVEHVAEICSKYNVLRWNDLLPTWRE
jgi:D-aminopeptidase